MLVTLLWLVLFASLVLWLAYTRASLAKATLVLGVLLVYYTLFGDGAPWWKATLWALFVPHVLLNIRPLRRVLISNRFLLVFKRMLPSMSTTEREALEAGTVWWDGELFTGEPGLAKAAVGARRRQLTAEEQAFLDGPCEELCRMLDDWDITHRRADLPPRGLGLHQEEGLLRDDHPEEVRRPRVLRLRALLRAGEAREPLEHGRLDRRRAELARPGRAAAPLRHRGAEEPLPAAPRARRGDPLLRADRPARRLGRGARCRTPASSAAACTRAARSLGIRLNFSKRYITLAPIATVIGLAFRLFDPDKLLGGDKTDYGITCALIPRDTPGITIGRRHFPLNVPFQNGPIQGKDVFVPLDCDHRRAEDGRPGLAHAGRAAVGRPLHLAAVERDRRREGRRVRLRRLRAHPPPVQPAGRQVRGRRGRARAHGRRAPTSWTPRARSRPARSTAARSPSVPSAILKYHVTEIGRKVANDAMDVHGGKGIMLGPKNYLGRGYQMVPVAHHGRGREHPDAQPDHLRPGRDPLPSVRAEGDERARRTRTASAASTSSTARCSGTSASRSRTPCARSSWR